MFTFVLGLGLGLVVGVSCGFTVGVSSGLVVGVSTGFIVGMSKEAVWLFLFSFLGGLGFVNFFSVIDDALRVLTTSVDSSSINEGVWSSVGGAWSTIERLFFGLAGGRGGVGLDAGGCGIVTGTFSSNTSSLSLVGGAGGVV